MNPEYVDKIEKWISANAEFYINNHPENSEEYNLKLKHTFRVKEAIEKISGSLQCSEALMHSAKAAALLHDAGRFRQFAEYNTFSDVLSEDHAELGLKIIQESGLLNDLDRYSADSIIFAVRNHNKYQINQESNKDSLFLAKMLRDADKIDILNVVAEYYTGNDSEKIAGMLNLPDTAHISAAVCRDIAEEKIPEFADIKSCSDLKLLQMSWVYDINFEISLEIIKENRYLDLIYSTLPDADVIKEIFHVLKKYLYENTSKSCCRITSGGLNV